MERKGVGIEESNRMGMRREGGENKERYVASLFGAYLKI
jgi:hypothetical protein